MQPGGPSRRELASGATGQFTLIEPLGSTQVGSVWSAIGTDGTPATVAVLDATVAADQQWREAFAAAATALANPHSDGPQFLSANFSGSAPWAAFAASDGPGAELVFQALGVEYQLAPPTLDTSTTAPTSPTSTTSPTVAGPAAQPATEIPIVFAPIPAAQPMTAAPFGTVGGADPRGTVGGADPRGTVDEPSSRRGAGPWIGVAVIVILLAATMVIAWRTVGGLSPSSSATPTVTTPAAPPTTTVPPRPGLEPPRPGNWPAVWPKYGAETDVREMTLDGFGFTFKAPVTWSCSPDDRTADAVTYGCRVPIGGDRDIGGELIVRDCPAPCDANRQTAMRATEHAWGQQWRFAGRNVTIAETRTLNGEPSHYALALIAYWSSAPRGPIDRQLVLRMDCPELFVDDIRRFANSIRDALKF